MALENIVSSSWSFIINDLANRAQRGSGRSGTKRHSLIVINDLKERDKSDLHTLRREKHHLTAATFAAPTSVGIRTKALYKILWCSRA